MGVACLLGPAPGLCLLLEHSSFSSPCRLFCLRQIVGILPTPGLGCVCPNMDGKLESEHQELEVQLRAREPERRSEGCEHGAGRWVVGSPGQRPPEFPHSSLAASGFLLSGLILQKSPGL